VSQRPETSEGFKSLKSVSRNVESNSNAPATSGQGEEES